MHQQTIPPISYFNRGETRLDRDIYALRQFVIALAARTRLLFYTLCISVFCIAALGIGMWMQSRRISHLAGTVSPANDNMEILK